MIRNDSIIFIEKLLNNKKIVYSKLLSDSFNINCIRIKTSDNQNFIVKYYNKTNNFFNAVESERKNLIFLNNLNLEFFPKVYSNNNKYLIISFLNNNNLQPKKIEVDLLEAIIAIHSFNDKEYGFKFDTQVGGMKLINELEDNWVNFFCNKRLNSIFDAICKSNPMPKNVNKMIESLLKDLKNRLPSNPKASLLHGDLWEGNILFNDEKFTGLIDPGSFFGHSEMEVAYLRWFNPDYIDNNFIKIYSEYIPIDKSYFSYEYIYQLYYSLMNVHLWSRSYIDNCYYLLKKII